MHCDGRCLRGSMSARAARTCDVTLPALCSECWRHGLCSHRKHSHMSCCYSLRSSRTARFPPVSSSDYSFIHSRALMPKPMLNSGSHRARWAYTAHTPASWTMPPVHCAQR